MKGLLLFEDERARELAPLTDLLPLPALAFGGSTIARRWAAHAALPLAGVAARPHASACWRDAPPMAVPAGAPGSDVPLLAVNAAVLPEPALIEALVEPADRPRCFVAGNRLVAIAERASVLTPLLERGDGFVAAVTALDRPAVPVEARFLDHPWDLVTRNPGALEADLRGPFAIEGEVHPSAVIEGRERVRIARGARVDALAVIDAREGPVVLEEGVIVQSHTLVRGPCVVGRGTQLLGGLVGRSTIGPDCRLAGEIEDCIWQGRGNKRHHGFAGHSVFGEWVNLGALTTTSDLKNTYGIVRVRSPRGEEASGTNKLGALVGAHVKTGIGTLLPTGAWVGAAANLFGGGRFAPKCVPSFAWWDGARMAEHRIEDFLNTARTAMARRGCELGDAEVRALRAHHAASAAERALPGSA